MKETLRKNMKSIGLILFITLRAVYGFQSHLEDRKPCLKM
jgi:hypothetical protein